MSVQDTSAAVYYQEVRPKLGLRQHAVLDALKLAKRPVCNQEIAMYLEQPINTITPRINELVKMGLVFIAFKDIYPYTGRRVIYWKIDK